MKKIVASISVLCLLAMALPKAANAQVLTPADNGIIPDPPKSYHHNMVFPYPFVREADLMWSTRHWERINTKHKANFHLYYPIQSYPGRKSLYDVIVDGILKENTIVEVFANDNFEIPLTPDQVYNYVNMIDTIRDPDDPTRIVLIDTISISAKDVVAWEIKSDWFFDKQRGEMKNRIIGLSPVVRNPQTQEKYNLFWVWFPDARYALATHQAYNTQNRAMRLTYDQIFHLRYFDSVIYKEDNVYDRSIAEYKKNSNLDQLLEAQRIKHNLRSFESELWEY